MDHILKFIKLVYEFTFVQFVMKQIDFPTKYIEIFVGTQVISTMWATDANILVGLHDSSYTIWYCPGEACMDPTVIALTKITLDIT